jgi:hypothetical protein
MAWYAGQKIRSGNLGAQETAAIYQATVNQSIPTNTVTTVAFAGINQASPYVTRNTSGPGHTFTLNAAGIWALSANIRFFAAAGGFREGWLGTNLGLRMHGMTQPGSAAAQAHLTFGVTRWFGAGAVVQVACFHDQGGPLDLVFNGVNAWGVFELTYVLGEGL